MDQTAIIEALRKKIQEQDELLKKLTEGASGVSVIVGRENGHLLIASQSSYSWVSDPGYGQEGDLVRVHQETGQILGVIATNLPIGKQSTVEKIDGKFARIEENGSSRYVSIGKTKPKEGDLIALDPFNLVISKILERDAKIDSRQIGKVAWDEICGHDEAKGHLRAAIEYPLQYGALYKKYDKRPAKGVLLYGPPGCGKTLLAKAAATAAATSKGKVGFRDIKGPEILTPYVGETERKVRELFLWAKEHKRNHSHPAVVFIDEAESLLSKRGSGISSDMERTIVPAFLTEMDGLDESGAFVILATNRPDILDSAIVREGRIDRAIEIKRPNEEESRQIFQLYLQKGPIASDVTCEGLSHICAEAVFANQRLKERVSGALISTIVEETKQIALARDIAANATTPSGITLADANAAISRLN